MKRFVVVESPYAGDVEKNVRYARAALRDCFKRHEVPFASHLLYAQPGVLDDDVPAERLLGIEAGFAVGDSLKVAAIYMAQAARDPTGRGTHVVEVFANAFYIDLGWSPGMRAALLRAITGHAPIVVRALGTGWSDRVLGDVPADGLDLLAIAEGRS